MDIRRWITIGLAAVAATAATATATATATGVAAAAATPAQHAYRQQDLQRDLNAITATGVPGVLAEVRTGARELRGTSGVADLVSREPVNGNDAGKITVRELLQHTSGLHNYTDDLQAQITSVEAYRELEFRQFSRQDLLNIALAHRPDFAPGAGWNYSNTNYILLGMIIEKVSHDSWEDQVTRRIIIPLGLHHTYAPGTSTRLPRPHATGYLIFDKDTRFDTTAENMSWADSAGALISNATDLSRFWSAIGRGTLLRPAQKRQMRQTVPASGGDSASVPGSRYGLGIFFIPLSCGGGYWSHEGDVPGYNTVGAVSADGHTTVVLSINSNVDDPVLAAEYHLVDDVMCHHAG